MRSPSNRLCVLAILGACLAAEAISSRAQTAGNDGAASSETKTDSAKTIISPLTDGLTVLRVRFASKPGPSPQRREPTQWDGQVSVTGAKLARVRLWFDDPRDNVDGNRWVLSTKHNTPWSSEERKKGHDALPVTDTALVVELADASADAELAFDTAQGKFRVRLSDVPLGSTKNALNALVQVSRLPNATTLLSSPTEDEYPAAAIGPDGAVWAAYVAFTHGPSFRQPVVLAEEPKSLDFLAEPTGGDQLFLLRVDGRETAGPLPVTPPGQDLFRPAVAIDGGGRVWVFWTAKEKSQWNLFARSFQGENWSPRLQLTGEASPDLFPAAATDSAGRVWVTWQAFREGKSQILAMRQDGDRFAPAMTVAAVASNCWAPAIAASADGQVAIAWDTYEKGDYDVHCRLWAAGQWQAAFPVAASLAGELRSSLAFDKAHRLWIAYETTPENMGKDWGGLKKEGVNLYAGHSVDVRVWADGKLWQTPDNAADAFAAFRGAGRAKNPAQKAPVRSVKHLAAPRLCVDAVGRVWLAVRSAAQTGRSPTGPWWFEHAAWYDGQHWSGQVICPKTDGILDNRPALLARPSGETLLVASSDGRAATAGKLPAWFLKDLRQSGKPLFQHPLASPWPDAVNNELTLVSLRPSGDAAVGPMRLQPAEPTVAQPRPEALAEAAAVARARAARVECGGRSLRLWRGEFHRHTELSSDGGGDGMLMDMWRYALDMAALDWVGNGDHDNGNGRDCSWWYTQKTTDLFLVPGAFSPMHTYERSCTYPDGHRNVVFAQRGVRTLPRLRGGKGEALDQLPADAQRPHSPDTLLLYRYLTQFDGVCASHTSGTDMGTDWRDNDPRVEPVVEIYQGCRQNYEMPDAPRANTAEHSIGGWRPLGFVSLALKKGYRLGFQSSSDHGSTHMSFCNCWVDAPTREAVLAALKARRVYGATDNIVAWVRCGEHFMGEEFTTNAKPRLKVHLEGTAPFAKVHVIKDGAYAHTLEPRRANVDFEWSDMDAKSGATSYYYVRGEQENGELVWASPLWIAYKP